MAVLFCPDQPACRPRDELRFALISQKERPLALVEAAAVFEIFSQRLSRGGMQIGRHPVAVLGIVKGDLAALWDKHEVT